MDLNCLNRRSFLKTAVITGGAASLPTFSEGLVPSASAATPPVEEETKIVKTSCRACIHNCGVLAHVRNGRVVKLEGNPEYPMSHGAVCAKCLAGITAVYHPDRNKYPMVRVGERGEGKWKRISWKEAIDTMAKKICENTDKYGAESIIVSTGGGGNPAFRGVRKLANAIGTPNFWEPGCAQCFLPRTVAFGIQYGGPTTSIADSHCEELYDPNNQTKVLVLWGTDVSYSCPGGGGRVLADLRAKGMKTVSIDPRFVPDAAKADVWLPIRPGTDVALMLGWIRYIIANNLFDKDFVMKWTNLPYLVDTETKFVVKAKDMFGEGGPQDCVVWDAKSNAPKKLTYPWDDSLDVVLDGEFKHNGKTYKTGFRLLKERAEPWTLEKCGEICWLDPKKIEEAIKLYTSAPGGVSLGVATDQNQNSVEAAMGAVILNAIMGNVERPGALLQRRPSSGVVPAGSLATACPWLLPKGQLTKRLGGNEHKGLGQWDAAQPTAVRNAMIHGTPYQPHMWIERSGNKFGVAADAAGWAEATKHVDFIVHMFMYQTSFSQYVDMILPATEWLETNMLVENLNMVFARQAVVHTWETEDETVVWGRLIRRCAQLGHKNAQRACDPEFMKRDVPYMDTIEEFLDARLKNIGTTWKGLLEKNPVAFMPYDKWHSYYLYKTIDPKTGLAKGFGTPTKKIELYGDCYITLARTGKPWALDELPPASKDYDPLPWYAEPAESPLREEIAKDYPLVMTNGRLPMYHHGTLRNSPLMREIYPVPELWVNPVDAKKYGVAQGDWAWIESKRGKIRGKVRVTEGIPVGVVYQERFWLPETLHTATHGWQEVNVNVLSKATAPFNDVVGTYTLRGYQVRISKADKAPDGIWQKPEDFKPWMPKPTDTTPNPEF